MIPDNGEAAQAASDPHLPQRCIKVHIKGGRTMEILEENTRFVLKDGDKEIGEMTWSEAGETLDHRPYLCRSRLSGSRSGRKLVAKGWKSPQRTKENHSLCPFAKRI